MGKQINLKLNEYEVILLQACLGNQILQEKKNNTQSEFYYFAKDMIYKLGMLLREPICKKKQYRSYFRNRGGR